MHSDIIKSPDRVLKAGLRMLGKPFASVARHMAGSIRGVRTTRPVAALTFDDGPHSETTPQVLDILKRHGARGTFFMIGEAAAQCPKIVEQAVNAGHVVGNHTWSHRSLPMLTSEERLGEIRACERILEPFGQKLFRPPYGHQSWRCRWETLRLGYEVIAFSVHAEDWLDHDGEWMAAQLVKKIRPGSILILHDQIYRSVVPNGHHDRRQMLSALDQALARLKHQYKFVTVPELLRQGPPVRVNWYDKSPPDLEFALRQHVL
ncbi:MAG: polysaccharide deacetylase family protein, partial [Candidatus Binatia bacterium]